MSLQPSIYTIVDGEPVRVNEFFPARRPARAPVGAGSSFSGQERPSDGPKGRAEPTLYQT
jgi:hypothetical protein